MGIRSGNASPVRMPRNRTHRICNPPHFVQRKMICPKKGLGGIIRAPDRIDLLLEYEGLMQI
jgi:hypothetical protein